MTTLHDYQQAGVDWFLERFFVEQKLGGYLAADTGVGKTLLILELIRYLKALGECRRVIILAPLQVVDNVWSQEAQKHGYDFDVAIVQGTPSKRQRILREKHDIYLVNYELLQWLEGADIGEFDLLILDEATRVKSWTGKRTRALRRIRNRFRWRIPMSGTPSPKGYGDLHSQYFFCDDGEALGRTVGWFRQRFMSQYGRFRQWAFRASQTQTLLDAINPMTFRISADDYLDMPPVLYNDIWLDLPPGVQQQYNDMERELFLQLDSGDALIANGGGGKYVKCRQIANGAVYETDDLDERATHNLHFEKATAVKRIIEEAGGSPCMVAYGYDGDRDMLLADPFFRDAAVICGGVGRVRSKQYIEQWNRDEIPILLVQPGSLSHGVNMQYGSGRSIIFLSIPDQLDLYSQLVARIARQGVVGQVRVHHLLMRRTVDVAVNSQQRQKEGDQRTLLDALNEYRMSR